MLHKRKKEIDMRIIGEEISATMKSKVGTMFFKTPCLVTQRGTHLMQRMAWAKILREENPQLTDSEIDEEMAQSADLLFRGDEVLIRPDPAHMDLAFAADEVLQGMMSKRKIRFLNTHSAKVRDALRERGENWRMARMPISQDDMATQITAAKSSIHLADIYYYNAATGTRYLTAGEFMRVTEMSANTFRDQVREIVKGMKTRNRLGQLDVDLFPLSIPNELRVQFRELEVDALNDEELHAQVAVLAQKFRVELPANLRVEDVNNLEWRAEMSATLSREPNETVAADDELIQGISPEFFRQIEWLPGARVEKGQLIFDPLFDEAKNSNDPQLQELCDHRVRSIIFNIERTSTTIEFVNVGRISHSLARYIDERVRRSNVYIVQYKEVGIEAVKVLMVRFQKWGIAERLDEGKDLLQAIVESDDYADYIMDRRLACRQFGMNLPHHVCFGQLTEAYNGSNQYRGTRVRAYYYTRAYVRGTASDKIPPARFANPAFAHRFAQLMGKAAAIDMIVGRAATETGEPVFDKYYEVVRMGADSLPAEIVVTDQAGAFVKYQESFDELVGAYANCITRRKNFVTNYADFAGTYVEAFRKEIATAKANYLAHPRAYDELFVHRPYDTAGSGAFRWTCVLRRLASCNVDALVTKLKEAIGA